MLIRICGAKCIGIDAHAVTVEVVVSTGIGIHLCGLADAAVKESLLRTTTALQSLGLKIPGRKIVINLAPADTHKKGSGYDLPIALGVIAASEQMAMPGLGKYVIMGELGLDGALRPVPGALPMVEMSLKEGYEGCILPYECALETVAFRQTKVFGARTLTDVLRIVCEERGYESLLVGPENAPEYTLIAGGSPDRCMDFAEIVGQSGAKRALEIACAGRHHALLIGPPGSGKSSLAKAMSRILPPMTMAESLQTSKIYSVAGFGGQRVSVVRDRPFRAPHATISTTALVGGGSDAIIPGEISLAHNGILYLDEFLELPKKTIEVLRAPLEDKSIVISRMKSKVEYPADFTLIAATNPCPCGYYGEGDRCTCPVHLRNAYLSKLSGPISDRFDMMVWCPAVKSSSLMNRRKEESSAEVALRVTKAREIQGRRFASDGIMCNSQMDNKLLEKYCPLDDECKAFMEKMSDRLGLSARAFTRIIKLARTIADLEAARRTAADGSVPEDIPICIEHLSEAVSYRFLDRVSSEGANGS